MNPEEQPFIRFEGLISKCIPPEVLAFLRSLATSSAPLKRMVVEFVGTDDGKAIVGTYFFNHFCKYRRTLATFKRFRAFIATHSRHVVLSPLEELLGANIQCFTNNTSLHSCEELGHFLGLPSFVPNGCGPMGFQGSLSLQPIKLPVPNTNLLNTLSISL
jgi:hypothetical protein